MFAAEKARRMLDGKDPGGKGGGRIPGADARAVFDHETEGLSFRAEEAGIDGREGMMGLGGLLGGLPFGLRTIRLVGDHDLIVSIVEGEKGEGDTFGGGVVDGGGESALAWTDVRLPAIGQGEVGPAPGEVGIEIGERVLRARSGWERLGVAALSDRAIPGGARRESHCHE